MNDPLQALLSGPAKPSLFPPNSRYAGIDTGTLTLPTPVKAMGANGLRTPQPNGKNSVNSEDNKIVYLRRRFVPPPENFALLQEYTVVEGDRDRLDNIAAKYVGDPERFWQIADANAAMAPEELTEIVGRILRITLPAGTPGTQNGQ